MGKDRGRRDGHVKEGGPAWPGWRGALALMLAGMSANLCCCSRYDDPIFDRCVDTDNCRTLPGSICVDELCMCQHAHEDFCRGACRPEAECLPDAGAGDAKGECNTAADCPQPGEPRCGTATCIDGACGLELKPLQKLASQVAGDCRHLWCDGAGNLITIDDAGDTYNDGAQCTFDACEGGKPKNSPVSNKLTCPETGSGVCYQGDCVACIFGSVECGAGLGCDGVRCVPMHCVNDVWDQGSGETAKNCGGPCRPCDLGQLCKVASDCSQGVCFGGTCQAPTCSDGVRNDKETGADCGGLSSCARCPQGEGCKVGSDCASGVCWAGVCEPPTCSDGVLNGDEKDWDCGGSCPACP